MHIHLRLSGHSLVFLTSFSETSKLSAHAQIVVLSHTLNDTTFGAYDSLGARSICAMSYSSFSNFRLTIPIAFDINSEAKGERG